MIMSSPGNENIVEKASDALNFKDIIVKEIGKGAFNRPFHVLFGDIKGNMVMQMINHT
jgi:hypothetical protein